jgi:hypothetical protein
MELPQLLDQWHTGIRINHIAHSRAATRFERRGLIFGIVATACSAASGSALFSTIATNPAQPTSRILTVIAAFLSVATAVLAAMQTFLKYPELAALHKTAARKYGQLRRRFELQLASPPADKETMQKFTAELEEEWNSLDDESPNIPQDIFDSTKNELNTKLGDPVSRSQTSAGPQKG